jgi:hypothetical protein
LQVLQQIEDKSTEKERADSGHIKNCTNKIQPKL